MQKIILCLIILGGMLLTCSPDSEQSATPSKDEVYVMTDTAVKHRYQATLTYGGVARPAREANLSPVLPGRVEKICVESGSRVRQGQLLAEMSGEMLTQADVERKVLEKDLGRISRLYEKGSIPEQQYDHIKAKYEAARAKYALIKKNTEIRAPFDGIVAEKMLQEGESFLMFNPGLKLGYSHASGVIRLIQLDSLKITIEVNEKNLSQIAKKQLSKVVFDARPVDTIPGRVVQIGTLLNTATKSAPVTIVIRNPGQYYKPGMYAEVTLLLPPQEQVFVPLQALYRQPGTGQDYIFTVDADSVVHRIPVTRGTTRQTWVAVDRIKPGTVVVTTGKSNLQEGQPVKIHNKQIGDRS